MPVLPHGSAPFLLLTFPPTSAERMWVRNPPDSPDRRIKREQGGKMTGLPVMRDERRAVQLHCRPKVMRPSATSAMLIMLAVASTVVPSTMAWLPIPLVGSPHKRKPTKNSRMQQQQKEHIFSKAGAAATAFVAAAQFAASTAAPAAAIESSIGEGQIPPLNPAQRRYATVLSTGTPEEISAANEALLDHAVGTINTMFYDNTGGNNFDTKRMYSRWGALRAYAKGGEEGLEKWKRAELRRVARDRADWVEVNGGGKSITPEDSLPPEISSMPEDVFGSRENAVTGLNWLVSTLHDPYSKYLTKEQLSQELRGTSCGFMGIGAIVEAPQRAPDTLRLADDSTIHQTTPQSSSASSSSSMGKRNNGKQSPSLLDVSEVVDLPVVTAITPNSLAERDGIVVGDRIVSVGKERFLGFDRDEVARRLDSHRYDSSTASSLDRRQRVIAIAKPVTASDIGLGQARLLGYRVSRVSLQTPSSKTLPESGTSSIDSNALVQGGDGIVNYKLIKPSNSIFQRAVFGDYDTDSELSSGAVGYIRLTRFSRASTAGYVKAVRELEAAGAQSYIIDLRNNYGGVVQDAMLTASTLLRDPHSVLCYTLNSRGGFTPHDVEEYLVEKRFKDIGYLLSTESPTASIDQAKMDDPDYFDESPSAWSPPSAYASLHEQGVKRNLHRTGLVYSSDGEDGVSQDLVSILAKGKQDTKRLTEKELESIRAQKELVILINEGTASAAEVFAAALHDNGRSVALIGSKTYGKGLIQHTFPMPDGGGLRISVAEYLTPGLRHVTTVGSARYSARTGDLVGGGIRPDIECSNSQGIPSDIGADICVGVALDTLDIATAIDREL